MYKFQAAAPEKTAVLVIDMIKDFVKEGFPMYFPQGGAIIPPMKAFIDTCRAKGMPVIFTTQTHKLNDADMGFYGRLMDPIGSHAICREGGEGAEIVEELGMQPSDMLVVKHNYSAFYGTDLDLMLRSMKVTNVVIVGVCTEMCCAATAREAINHGYETAFISDLTATFDYPDLGFGAFSSDDVQRSVLTIMRMTTCDVMAAADFLAIG